MIYNQCFSFVDNVWQVQHFVSGSWTVGRFLIGHGIWFVVETKTKNIDKKIWKYDNINNKIFYSRMNFSLQNTY